MEQNKKKSSLSLKVAAVVIVVIVIAVAAFADLTYPRTVLSVPVSFTIGADVVHKSFEVPILNDAAQVQVSVNSGGALWSAEIISGNNTLFTHRAAQGEQTSYNSQWISLSPGMYNFTFATLGAGSLNAQVTVKTKGGFW